MRYNEDTLIDHRGLLPRNVTEVFCVLFDTRIGVGNFFNAWFPNALNFNCFEVVRNDDGSLTPYVWVLKSSATKFFDKKAEGYYSWNEKGWTSDNMEHLFRQEYATEIRLQEKKTRSTIVNGEIKTINSGVNIQILRQRFAEELVTKNTYLGRYPLKIDGKIIPPDPRRHVVKLQCTGERPVFDVTVAKLEVYSKVGAVLSVSPGLNALRSQLGE